LSLLVNLLRQRFPEFDPSHQAEADETEKLPEFSATEELRGRLEEMTEDQVRSGFLTVPPLPRLVVVLLLVVGLKYHEIAYVIGEDMKEIRALARIGRESLYQSMSHRPTTVGGKDGDKTEEAGRCRRLMWQL
jgi:DNA-directed RNA polymerase specialized sigma24 family protein